MRIIAGDYKGRRLKAPRRRARPSTDMVREACFSILGSEIVEADVLDLYAGSGAFGLEALSRGAASADFVEVSRDSLGALAHNIATLGVRNVSVVHQLKASLFITNLAPHAYDVAFADPPYESDQAGRMVEAFREAAFARILIVEHSAKQVFEADRVRNYGNTTLSFLFE